ITDSGGIFYPKRIRLALRVPAEFEQHQAQALRSLVCKLSKLWNQNYPRDQTQLAQQAVSLLSHRMSCGNMTDLMSQHPGKFGLIIKVGHNTAGEIHIASRQGKSIYNR